MSTHFDAELERRIDDAIEDAIPDAAELRKVEQRRGTLVAEAQAEDDSYARELIDRLDLVAARIPIDVSLFLLLVSGEIERARTGRRRCAAHALPTDLLAEQAEALLAEGAAEDALAAAQRIHSVVHSRRTVADAAVRVYGTDRRERA